MKNAVILHGKPTKERFDNPDVPKPHEANWFPWIANQLSTKGVEVSIPPLPKPYFPDYNLWKGVFESHKIDVHSGLVGHSAGAEFILRWFSENKEAVVERIVLVAPWHDSKNKYGEFSTYDLDRDITKRTGRLTIINSLDDDELIQMNVQRLSDEFPSATIINFDGYGHFRIGNNMLNEEFPELLKELFIL